MKRLIPLALVTLALLPTLRPARAQDGLRPGDYVAITGDSITEQKTYSVFIQDYLLMCRPKGIADLRATQFGWGGETAPGFAARMQNDMLRFGCTVATTCFGMNDGGYSPMDPAKAQRYRDGQTSIVEQLKKANVRFIVVGSPGCVDFDTFRNDPEQAVMYNKVLAEERDIAREVAKAAGVTFADVFQPMYDVTTKAKAKYGKQYHVAGGDGFHPDQNGHLVMAYAFLKALGADGDIGTITLDLASGRAQATDGHKVLSSAGGAVEVESSRYPFCFSGDPASTNATRGVIEFFPFNEELNRFRLVVTGAPADRLNVTWGSATKEFAKADLEKGINLAADFLDGNPFAGAFERVHSAVRQQQEFETPLVKSLIHNVPQYAQMLPDEKETLERLATAGIRRDRQLIDASLAAVQPVKHTIKVEAVK